MIRLSAKQVRMLHKELIEETGGLHGVRDEGLLDSALSLPF
jgi:death-on-curing protein